MMLVPVLERGEEWGGSLLLWEGVPLIGVWGTCASPDMAW